jgi:hypothetical protein
MTVINYWALNLNSESILIDLCTVQYLHECLRKIPF